MTGRMGKGRRILPGLWLLATVAGAAGAADFGEPRSGVCARCHERQASLAGFQGGHARFIDCVTCHDQRRPSVFGPRHRATTKTCTSHHATPVDTHPVPDHPPSGARRERNCLKCHDPHGSTNLHLVRTPIRTRGRFRPIEFVATGDDATPSFVDEARPGRGLCEVCHKTTRFYPASGQGESHFTGDCTRCHDHAVGFKAVASDANCATCHPDEAALLEKPNLHHDRFAGECSSCHAEVDPTPGPGHRDTAACVRCHSPQKVADHVPPGIRVRCEQCHDPHGTDNLRLVRGVIETTGGAERPITFTTLAGLADGSFASASAPGTGLCEVCHTSTRFYRADGSGAAHYTTTCLQCHPHSAGFLPD